jgi:hypothetical protein
MLAGGQKYRYNDNDVRNKLLQDLVEKVMMIIMMTMTMYKHNSCAQHKPARLVVTAHSTNTIEG